MIIIGKAISGGQTGVDIGSLRGARARGIPTGGMMPKGFKTQIGPRPEWAAEFGLTEHASDKYPPRTFDNVKAADFTVRIALDLNSAGELCTMRAIRQYRRPFADIPLRRSAGLDFIVYREDIEDVARMIVTHRVFVGRPLVVNFAGNSERTAPGIEARTPHIVTELIDRCAGMWNCAS